MNSINTRLNEALDSTGLKDVDIARNLGLSRGAISQWRSGMVKSLKADTAADVQKLTGYSANWIATGRGDKLVVDAYDENVIDVPVLSSEASMGSGYEMLDPEVISAMRINKEWVNRFLYPKPNDKNLRFIHAYGDSMEPTFQSGDVLLVDIGHTSPDIDGIYVLEANQMLFIKRVSRTMAGDITITSDNPKIKTSETLNGDQEVIVHGRVIYAWNGKTL